MTNAPRSPMSLARTCSLVAVIVAASAGTIGCGNSSGPGPVIDAGFSINGHPFTQGAAGALHVFTNNDITKPAGYIVELYGSETDGCQQIMASGTSGTSIRFTFSDETPHGTYEVNIGNVALYVDGKFDNKTDATGGHLTIVQFNNSDIDFNKHVLAGTYDVNFKSGEHLAGQYSAPICNN